VECPQKIYGHPFLMLNWFYLNYKSTQILTIWLRLVVVMGRLLFPLQKGIKGKLYGFDIEEGILDIVNQKIKKESIVNVILEQRDVLIQTTGLADNSIDYVMLFNILHHESPTDFMNEAFRILKPNGKVGIIHWRSDVETPRGPHLTIRPKPEQVLEWGKKHK